MRTADTDWFQGFEEQHLSVGAVTLRVRTGGRPQAPALLLLHGFPQTHVMWHRVARHLAPHFQLVLPDLRGYGDSDKPEGGPDHAAYSKRAMAGDVAALMTQLGHARYAVCGHDRGGRVAHRLALDHPQAVSHLCLLDIAPTLDMYGATDMDFARAYYHWFHLIQPAPLPERMIGGCARDYLHAKLGGWGYRRAGPPGTPSFGRLRALLLPSRSHPRRLRGLPRRRRHRPDARPRFARGGPAHRL